MAKEKIYNLHLRLSESLKEQLEAKASLNGYSSINSYVNYLVEQSLNTDDSSRFENIINELSEVKKNQVDASYFQSFMSLCIEMLLATNGNYDQVEYALNEIDEIFSKSRYREPVGLEKLSEFTKTTKALFVQNASKNSPAKSNSMLSQQQPAKPKQRTIDDLEFNEIMIDPESGIPYRRVPLNELYKCKNVPRSLLNQYLEIWKTKPDAVFESDKIIIQNKVIGTTHKLYKSDLDGGYIRVMEDR